MTIDEFLTISDLSLIIEEKEGSQKTSISDFQELIESIAEDLKPTFYYSMYKPVVEEETRLFHVRTFGPLNHWRNTTK